MAHDVGGHIDRGKLADLPEGRANACTVSVQLLAFIGREPVGRELAVERAVDSVVHGDGSPVGVRVGSGVRRAAPAEGHI
jgi:hypothetical protein